MTTDRDLLVRMQTACHTLGLDKARAGAIGALGELLDLVTVHLNATADPVCSCDVGPDYDGPAVDCDLHGQPSAAYAAGAREALGNFAAILDVHGTHPLAEQCREYARSFTGPGTCSRCGCTDERACAGGCSWVTPTLCSACVSRDPWQPCPHCRRYTNMGERHLVVIGTSGPDDSPEPEYECFGADGQPLEPSEVVLGLVTQVEPAF